MTQRDVRGTGAALLGPVFYRFLLRLHTAQAAYDPADTRVLFLARGGIRLRRLYQEFLAANHIPAPMPFDDFYVSRMALIKVNLLDHYETVYRDLAGEYQATDVAGFVSTFFGADVCKRWRAVADPELAARPVTLESLDATIWGSDPAADVLRRALHQQADLYADYLDAVVGGRSRVVVVDTGWSGSIAHYLQTFDPKRDYTALYFGRHSYGRPTPAWYPQVVGLAVEAETVDPRRPQTALLAYRHLVEGVCEIRVPSVTGYTRGDVGGVPHGGFAPEDRVLPGPDEALAAGILDYVRRAPNGLRIAAVERSSRQACEVLWRRLMYPNRADVATFGIPTRSADFGKDLDVPVILPAGFRPRSKRANVRESLWPAGQLAVELPATHAVAQFAYHRRDRPRRAAALLRRRAGQVRSRLAAVRASR